MFDYIVPVEFSMYKLQMSYKIKTCSSCGSRLPGKTKTSVKQPTASYSAFCQTVHNFYRKSTLVCVRYVNVF